MLGLASGLGTECAIELGGKCFTAPFTPTPLTKAQCNAEKDKLGIKECNRYNEDYWAGAVKQCGGVSKMPTLEDLYKLASQLYVGNPSIGVGEIKFDIQYDPNSSVSKALGLTPDFELWSGVEDDDSDESAKVYVVAFFDTYMGWGRSPRNVDSSAVCLGD